MNPVNAMRLVAGHYWTVGGFEIWHDTSEGGTGDWIVLRRGDTDNPLAFCDTLLEARTFIASELGGRTSESREHAQSRVRHRVQEKIVQRFHEGNDGE